jgi:hypothetical protein
VKLPIRAGFFRELFSFATSGRRLWLLPIILLLVVVSVLAAVGALLPYGFFMYGI